jgi:hypothetical protein
MIQWAEENQGAILVLIVLIGIILAVAGVDLGPYDPSETCNGHC